MIRAYQLTLAAAASCPFGFSSSEEATASDPVTQLLTDEIIWPSQLLTCPQDKVLMRKTEYFDRDLYIALVNDIIELYNTFADSEVFPQRSFAGCFLRFAGHDMLDFRYTETGTSGGNDGCIKLDEPDNAGLARCTEQSRIQEIYAQWCDVISLADFLVIAAEAVMGRTSTNHDERDRWSADLLQQNRYGGGNGDNWAGNLLLQFMGAFRFGRETKDTCDGVGLMPDAEKGCNDVQDIMVDQMYRDIVMSGETEDGADNWQAATALMGAHSLGSARLENSGYQGHWSTIENQGVFNNNYYRSILAKGWAPQFSVGGREDRNQWKRVDLMEGENDEMMLTSDMCLFYDQNMDFRDCMIENADVDTQRGFRQCKHLEAESIDAGGTGDFLFPLETGDCCAWTWVRHQVYDFSILERDVPADWCGMEIVNRQTWEEASPVWQMTSLKQACCGDLDYPECTSSNWAHGIGYKVVSKYAGDESMWLRHYLEAWTHATENGYTDRETDVSTLGSMSATVTIDASIYSTCSTLVSDANWRDSREFDCQFYETALADCGAYDSLATIMGQPLYGSALEHCCECGGGTALQPQQQADYDQQNPERDSKGAWAIIIAICLVLILAVCVWLCYTKKIDKDDEYQRSNQVTSIDREAKHYFPLPDHDPNAHYDPLMPQPPAFDPHAQPMPGEAPHHQFKQKYPPPGFDTNVIPEPEVVPSWPEAPEDPQPSNEDQEQKADVDYNDEAPEDPLIVQEEAEDEFEEGQVPDEGQEDENDEGQVPEEGQEDDQGEENEAEDEERVIIEDFDEQ